MSKGLKVLVSSTVIAALLVTAVFAANKTADAIKAEKSPAIDGKMDTMWSKAPAIDVKELDKGWYPDNTSEASAKVRMMWDQNNFYVYAQVTDKELYATSKTEPWINDSFEVVIDQKNNKTKPNKNGHTAISFNDETAGQFRVGALDGSLSGIAYPWTKKVLNDRTFKAKSVKTKTGYDVEMSIPWTVLKGKIKSSTKIGFDAQINDDSEGFGRDGAVAWNLDPGGQVYSWQWTDVMGTVTLK